MPECEFCKKILSSKKTLKVHQKTTKSCLKKQGKSISEKFKCQCGKKFTRKDVFVSHQSICKFISKEYGIKLNIEVKQLELKNSELDKTICTLKRENEMLRSQLDKLQDRYDKLATTAVKRPTVSNKTIQINNYIKNMPVLTTKHIEDSVPLLTLEHHVKGAEGYAEFALEVPFKDKIVCVDVSRDKIKYKNSEGDVIEDVGFRKMMKKLCKAVLTRSFQLGVEHQNKLYDSGDFTEAELDLINFNETAIAMAKYARGRENDFCTKVIKLISKGSCV